MRKNAYLGNWGDFEDENKLLVQDDYFPSRDYRLARDDLVKINPVGDGGAVEVAAVPGGIISAGFSSVLTVRVAFLPEQIAVQVEKIYFYVEITG